MELNDTDRIPLTHLSSYQSSSLDQGKKATPSEYSQLEVDESGHEPVQDNGAHQNKAHIAVRASRNIPIIQWLTHGSSMLFTVALFLLCARNVYFADVSQPNVNSQLNAFQFVARFHEIILSASVTMMVIHRLRYELCTADGVPLGFLTNAYSLAQPQMLFTNEFWSAATSSRSNFRKYWFCLILVAGTILIALSGPSSAILIIPQLGWWDLKHSFSNSPMNGYSWVNFTYEDHWPLQINSNWIPNSCQANLSRIDGNCPYGSRIDLSLWATDYLSQWALPNVTIESGAGMLRYLTASNTTEQGHNGYAVASTGMMGLTRDMGTLWLYANREDQEMAKPDRPMVSLRSVNQSRPLLKPLVQAHCNMPVDMTNKTDVELEFPTSQLIDKDGQALKLPTLKQSFATEEQYTDDGRPSASYVDLSTDAGRQLLGVVVSIQFANPKYMFPAAKYGNADQARGLMACTLLPKWVPTTMSRDVRTDNVLIVDNADPADIVTSPDRMAQSQDVEVDITWADGSNPYINPNNDDPMSVLQYQLSYFAFSPPFFDGNWTTRWPWLISSMLSMTMAEGLARLSYYDALYIWHENPRNKDDAFAWNIVDLNNQYSRWEGFTNGSVSDFIEASPDLYYPVQWTVQRFGYAWGFERVTKYLAASVILLHMLWVVVHLVWISVINWRCDSWNSLTKLVVLAIQSPPTKVLKGTSTSIDDRYTYTDTVRIRESKDRDGRTAILDVTNIREYRGTPFLGGDQGYSNVYANDDTKLRIGKKYT